MNWPGPILTDSGGFQVWSLAKLRKMDEDGVEFRSHLDGDIIRLTPERAVEIQRLLGADIAMVLDECTPLSASEREVAESMRLSMRWAKRCKDAYAERPGHGLFGIVQGGVYAHLRAEAAETLAGIGFDGYAIGGLSVGEGQAAMFKVVERTAPWLPAGRPRYLMGVGKPADLVGAVARGIDMFDCVLPTRSGRTDQAFTRMGTLNMRNARHRADGGPLDAACGCPACRGYSRAYLHHLVMAKEILGPMLLTWHNLHYYQDLMAGMRQAINAGAFDAFVATFAAEQAAGDGDPDDGPEKDADRGPGPAE
jgi:queuine tRNA-ribosyltransferase